MCYLIRMQWMIAVVAALLIGGCANDAQTGAGIGAAVGAGVGAAVDDDNRWRGAGIGAAIGGVSGYIIGNESDKAKARDQYNRY